MKKRTILNLIRYHVEKNEPGFRAEAYEIAHEFDARGDSELAAYIMGLMSDANVFVPQMEADDMSFLAKVPLDADMLLLPESVLVDIRGIVHSVQNRMGTNKFLFAGAPGTGKTAAARQLTKILGRELFAVDSAALVDSRLGQTQKNIAALFKSISEFARPEGAVILFDELDALALDRTNPNDLREMGRATTSVLKGLETLDERIVLVATTNLQEHFDQALLRRFDFVVDFNRYAEADKIEIAERMLDRYLERIKIANRDVRLFRKILRLAKPLPYPGDLQNLVKTAVAFSDPEDGTDYLRRLFSAVSKGREASLSELQTAGFTVREIGILTKRSKSGVARDLKGGV